MSYATIIADPPWPIKDTGARTESGGGKWDSVGIGVAGRASRVPYRTMSVEAICALPVRDLAASDAHLYLWGINAFLESAYVVARAWGFSPSSLLTWCKVPMGLGFGGTFVNTTEFVLFARRGSLPAKRRHDSTWFVWTRPHNRRSTGGNGPRHSAKPEAFYELVESVSPGPYMEMFARRERYGWATWGEEALA